jgi:hypothetical protein
MLLDEFCVLLRAAASKNGWREREEPLLVARRFRGGKDEPDARLAQGARGLLLGRYPVIVCELRLASLVESEDDLKAAHNQMVIARSYLSNSEVVDAHIFFAARLPSMDTDWRQRIDLIERNETVCRKLVWMPDSPDLSASFGFFIRRSFLAQPWQDVSQLDDVPLDQNENLVERALEAEGLSPAAAATWVKLANDRAASPDDLVEKLVAAMEESV